MIELIITSLLMMTPVTEDKASDSDFWGNVKALKQINFEKFSRGNDNQILSTCIGIKEALDKKLEAIEAKAGKTTQPPPPTFQHFGLGLPPLEKKEGFEIFGLNDKLTKKIGKNND